MVEKHGGGAAVHVQLRPAGPGAGREEGESPGRSRSDGVDVERKGGVLARPHPGENPHIGSIFRDRYSIPEPSSPSRQYPQHSEETQAIN
jgi:hypothetical protein